MRNTPTAPADNDVVVWQLTEVHGNFVVAPWNPLVETDLPKKAYNTEVEARMAARGYAEQHRVDVWKRRFGRPPLAPLRLIETYRPGH